MKLVGISSWMALSSITTDLIIYGSLHICLWIIETVLLNPDGRMSTKLHTENYFWAIIICNFIGLVHMLCYILIPFIFEWLLAHQHCVHVHRHCTRTSALNLRGICTHTNSKTKHPHTNCMWGKQTIAFMDLYDKNPFNPLWFCRQTKSLPGDSTHMTSFVLHCSDENNGSISMLKVPWHENLTLWGFLT